MVNKVHILYHPGFSSIFRSTHLDISGQARMTFPIGTLLRMGAAAIFEYDPRLPVEKEPSDCTCPVMRRYIAVIREAEPETSK